MSSFVSYVAPTIALVGGIMAFVNLYYRVRRNVDSIIGAKARIAELEGEMDRVNVFLKLKYPEEFKRDTYRGRTDY